jgi:hypothetical protein
MDCGGLVSSGGVRWCTITACSTGLVSPVFLRRRQGACGPSRVGAVRWGDCSFCGASRRIGTGLGSLSFIYHGGSGYGAVHDKPLGVWGEGSYLARIGWVVGSPNLCPGQVDSRPGARVTQSVLFDGPDQDFDCRGRRVDDAEVPDHLWLHAFTTGYGVRDCLERHRATLGLSIDGAGSAEWEEEVKPPWGWQGFMKLFRSFGLRFWKRGIVQGSTAWRRGNVPWQTSLSTPAQMVRTRMGMLFGEVQPIYEWTGIGRRAYRVQWSLLRRSEEGVATVEAEQDAIQRCANASWFEWVEGSAPLFWNWPEQYQREVWDGQPHFLTGAMNRPFMRPQLRHKEPTKHELMRAKVVKVRKLDYIRMGKVASGTNFFSIDKGATDIRMVYNGISCGLNDILFAPHFGLPTVRETLRALRPGSYQCDLDVQDQFLNFKLHKHMREFSGVDVKEVRSLTSDDAMWEESRQGRWEQWERNWMGLRDSLYRSLQWQVRLKLEVYGDRHNLANPFHWDRVELNLPGDRK